VSPQAGWYADPTDPAALRWWDGAQWSAETRPVPRELAMAGAVAPAATATATPGASVVTASPVATSVALSPEQPATPTLAPVATPAAVATPTPVPQASTQSDAATPAVVDRSRPRPRTMAMTPPPVRLAERGVEVYTPPPAAVPAEPVTTPPWAGATGSPSSSLNQFGSATNQFGSATNQFGSASGQFGTPVAGPGRLGAVPAGFGTSPSSLPGSIGPQRHWGRTLVVTGLVLAVLGGTAAFAVPRYLTARDLRGAGPQPEVLARGAPATLAGARRLVHPDARVAAEAEALTGHGATWAWSGSYGPRAAATSYVASDVPVDSRPDAVQALSSRAAVQQLMSTLATATVGAGSSIVMGTPTEYASPVGGKTWCMPVTADGIADGYCAWTNGKESLQVLSTPGLEQTAARSTLAALAQLAQISTKHPAAKP
jgi:hypothetical protein